MSAAGQLLSHCLFSLLFFPFSSLISFLLSSFFTTKSAPAPSGSLDTTPATAQHQKQNQRRWLGTFALPMAVLFGRSQVEGTFPIQMPSGLHGHVRQANPLSSMGLGGGQLEDLRVTTRGIKVEPDVNGRLASPGWARAEPLGRGQTTPTQLSLFIG